MFNLQPTFSIPNSPFTIVMPFVMVALCAILLFVLPRKSILATKITKLVLAGVLIGLYIFRAVFWFLRATSLSPTNTFSIGYILKTFGLDVNFYILLATVIVLIYTAFSKNNNNFIRLLKQTILGIGLPLAVIGLFNCRLFIDINDTWYHSLNLSSLITQLCFLLVPLYLIKTKEIEVKLNNFWLAICGYTLIVCLCFTLGIIFNLNVSELFSSGSLSRLGIKVQFPWHIFIVLPVFLIICFLTYLLVSYVLKLINRKKSKENVEQAPTVQNDFFDLYAFATKAIACMQGFLIVIILAALLVTPKGTLLGLLCFIPFLMTVFSLLGVFEMEKYINNYNETIFEKGNKDAKRILTYIFLGNFLFGFVIKKQFKNEREAIIDRKIREEKRKQKLLQKQQNELKK